MYEDNMENGARLSKAEGKTGGEEKYRKRPRKGRNPENSNKSGVKIQTGEKIWRRK